MAAQLCVALDGSDRNWIVTTARQLGPNVDWLKIGLEAFTAHGPDLVREMCSHEPSIFLDLKLHDIPTTVARAAANCARLGVNLLNVHAGGGRAMMEAAIEGVREVDPSGATQVIAVTILTSLDSSALAELGSTNQSEELVLRWAELARHCGLDGVVASAQEAPNIRRVCGPDFLIVTPGIRPSWAAGNDQRRIVTPVDAVSAGSNILVVGRPITTADDPQAAAAQVLSEMKAQSDS
ncbi:MAG: orotidine-5'-phosphate decarboxylase [Acidobacteriota bacterium]